MSLTGALNSAVSALRSQSTALSIISDNIANSGTTAYKGNEGRFRELVTQQMTSTRYSAGGVSVYANTSIRQQGIIEESSSATDIAVDGSGFFPVTKTANGKPVYWTRDGRFTVDESGYLTNNGWVLQGWPVDADGTVTAANRNNTASLEAIDVNRYSTTAAASTTLDFDANLPANAAVGDAFTTSTEVYDSLGTAHNIEITWTKTADNTWQAVFGDPTLGSDATTATGTVTSGAVDIVFNGDGTLASTNPDPVELTITGWSTGADDSTIAVNLGTVGSANGLSQYSQNDTTDLYVDVDSIDQDGIAYGRRTSVEITESGLVVAKFDNGHTVPIYKIPLATFASPEGLDEVTGGIYADTVYSGNYTLQDAGTGAAGLVRGGALEASTVDTAEEFSRMIVCQQAYSSASQIISTADEMYDSLLSAVR